MTLSALCFSLASRPRSVRLDFPLQKRGRERGRARCGRGGGSFPPAAGAAGAAGRCGCAARPVGASPFGPQQRHKAGAGRRRRPETGCGGRWAAWSSCAGRRSFASREPGEGPGRLLRGGRDVGVLGSSPTGPGTRRHRSRAARWVRGAGCWVLSGRLLLPLPLTLLPPRPLVLCLSLK